MRKRKRAVNKELVKKALRELIEVAVERIESVLDVWEEEGLAAAQDYVWTWIVTEWRVASEGIVEELGKEWRALYYADDNTLLEAMYEVLTENRERWEEEVRRERERKEKEWERQAEEFNRALRELVKWLVNN